MLTIGEFSVLGHISTRMLRHYDAIGLLRPAHIGAENGYRYYDPAQLSSLKQIETLKNYGFTLAEIAGLLPLPQQELAQRIYARRVHAYKELNDMRRSIRLMEDDIIRMEGIGMAMEKYAVIVMEVPEQKVFGIRRTISISEVHELFAQLHREMEARGLRRTGATQLICHSETFSYESMDVEAQAVVNADGPEIQTIPAMTCVATTHIGPYETTTCAYEALRSWFAQHPEYQVCGPAIERYLKDEGMVNSPEELETGILFPVKRV
ncbi:MerR family transcriptional regulator [Anaeromassilibacillus senegalensis]|uniref:MerR family transcriptional regulator n=1 Tax=Anaeromassilibacillus senegalensis TaxID=1673717 RepID=UPI000680E60D|nr:MerR family transcriptional regulator [Anaeromassilibacillus senegalensis]